MKPKVVIAGGTGFIGKYLEKKFKETGYDVYIISRQSGMISWYDSKNIVEALEGAELLINLAGKSVNCKYNKQNKVSIINSRIDTTRCLGEALEQCKKPPQLWINSSTATIYRHSLDKPMTEDNGEIGTGFSVEVAKLWEAVFFGFNLPQTRMVALRTAIVLGKNGGALEPYKNLVRLGLGGRQGNGKQMFSWIHEEDVFRTIIFLLDNKDANGIYNCSAPNPIRNYSFMRSLRNTMHVHIGIPCPEIVLKIGATIIGTEIELVLKSRWVLPKRLLQEGFEFKYENIDNALDHIIHYK